MTTTASIGHGIIFKLDNDAGTLTAVGEVTDVQPFSISRDVVDATHMGSTGRYREFIGGLRDAGEVTFTVNFDPKSATDVLLVAASEDDDARSFEITFPSGDKASGECFVTNYSASAPLDDKMTASVTLKITGAPTFTVAP